MSKKQSKKMRGWLYLAFLVIILFCNTLYHKSLLNVAKGNLETLNLQLNAENVLNSLLIKKASAQVDARDMTRGVIREVTMYSSTPEQTDDTPCIGAFGNVCEVWDSGQNICATNAYRKGTILYVDKLGECAVIDRMNKRFSNRIDWYAGYDEECLDGVDEGDNCPNYNRALKFGIQNLPTAVVINK